MRAVVVSGRPPVLTDEGPGYGLRRYHPQCSHMTESGIGAFDHMMDVGQHPNAAEW